MEEAAVEVNVSVEQRISVVQQISVELEGVKWHEVMAMNDLHPFSTEVERQQRRREVERTLSHLMPWNDARFSRINVRAARPFDCRSAGDWCRMLDGNLGATARVCIGTATFWCIPALLQLHSGYFSRHLRPVSRFREGADLCAVGFRAAYDWMRLQEPLDANSPPSKLVELLHTAIQLDMGSLEAMCNRYMCTSRFREQAAFEIYIRARPYPALHPQRQMMLQRIGFHFLAMVGGTHYLELPMEDLVTILLQDNLGVNTEVEVLYSVFRWMSARPAERGLMMRRLLECVRFTRLPMSMLCQMWRGFVATALFGDLNLLATFRGDLMIQRRISDAITVVNLRRIYQDRNEFTAACRSKGLAVEAPREWLYDENCPYHQARPRAPYSHVFGIDEFLDYAGLRAQRAQETPRELINLRATLPTSETEEQDDDDDLEQGNRNDLDYVSGELLRLRQNPQESLDRIFPPKMESASEREEEQDDEQPVSLTPEEWDELEELAEFEELESLIAQSEMNESHAARHYSLGIPLPEQALIPIPTSTASLVQSPATSASSSGGALFPTPAPASILFSAVVPQLAHLNLRQAFRDSDDNGTELSEEEMDLNNDLDRNNHDNHNGGNANNDEESNMLLGLELATRIGLHIPAFRPMNLHYPRSHARWLEAGNLIQSAERFSEDYGDVDGEEAEEEEEDEADPEANGEDEEYACPSCYAADLERMCNGQPLAPEVDVGKPEEQQEQVVPLESYLLETEEIIAQLLAKIGEKEEADADGVPAEGVPAEGFPAEDVAGEDVGKVEKDPELSPEESSGDNSILPESEASF
ncbi:uncharacterized protein Dana_GF21477, isoform C [Drosophila ananassae]|uniref:Uncharacterized protein, isoform C n=1 Tax=Drosophila ananassae TaxID=7217 RepID=B3MSI8_DROAN|nr:uncharacterized protein LOC6504159 isoform X1 [Drosophila ananassae]EDV34743.2 uncharacterized protein Dana_GF21477, isoform F [Drosophila ananassae]KPU75261.1 uncharacterized protein Dana_GF21477, isoform C [Drosophila ananassae]